MWFDGRLVRKILSSYVKWHMVIVWEQNPHRDLLIKRGDHLLVLKMMARGSNSRWSHIEFDIWLLWFL